MKKFLKKFLPWRIVNECCYTPTGFRTSYYRQPKRQRVCFWFGLHYIIMLIYYLWWLSYWYPKCKKCDYCNWKKK
jgi:hypothetical protein